MGVKMKFSSLGIMIAGLFLLVNANLSLGHDWEIQREKLSQAKRSVGFSESDFSDQSEILESSASQGIFSTNEDLEKRLYSFNKVLKEFDSEEGFDFIEFETHIEEIRNDISDIEFLSETELNDPEITRKINFSRQKFLSMVESTDKLKRYSRYDFLPYEMVCRIIELTIRALCLFDSGGAIDFGGENHVEELSLLYRSLYIFENMFKNVEVVPIGVRVVFENKCAQLKKILEVGRAQAKYLKNLHNRPDGH